MFFDFSFNFKTIQKWRKIRYRIDEKVLFHKNKLFQHQISKECGINKPLVI